MSQGLSLTAKPEFVVVLPGLPAVHGTTCGVEEESCGVYDVYLR